MFSNIDLGRLFYDHVERTVPGESFVLHQRAVFELRHRSGALDRAEAAAARAFELSPSSHSIQHTQAEIARRLANDSDDPLMRRSLRRTTREKLGGSNLRLSEYDLYTRGLLAIDEFRDVARSLDLAKGEPPPAAFVQAVRETEMVIQRGLQMYPESSELLSVEATFRECLDQTVQALEALERAFRLNPRQDWLAVRLARKYEDMGDLGRSKEVLELCLRDNPSSKSAHLLLGQILIRLDDSTGALDHLRRGFTEGDNNHEAQFWFARELHLQGEYDEARRLFSTLNERAPGRFRSGKGGAVERGGSLVRYECQIQRKEEGYAFVRVTGFPKDVFASRADSDPMEWNGLERAARARCSLAFNRRGPRAIDIRVGGGLAGG